MNGETLKATGKLLNSAKYFSRKTKREEKERLLSIGDTADNTDRGPLSDNLLEKGKNIFTFISFENIFYIKKTKDVFERLNYILGNDSRKFSGIRICISL